MWAVRPSYYDNDTPMDLRKKVVLQRDLEEQRESRPFDSTARIPQDPYKEKCAAIPPVASPFVPENSLVNPVDGRHSSSKGSLETAIRKLHHSRHFKTHIPRIRRSRSADANLENRKNETRRVRRSNSCPHLTITKSLPQVKARSPIKPKSYFIQRSSGYLYDSNSYHRTYENYRAHSPPVLGGAKKRKSFVPVYGDRCSSPKRTSSPKRFFDDRTSSPYMDHGALSPRRISPPTEDYYSEILLRRQLQQHSNPAYLVHVYDYYQQLVQRLREQTSPGVRMPPPMSPTSVDEDMQADSTRKRPCRALTGKHVRQGTGASLSTLLTLRQKIQERQQKSKDQPLNGFNGNKGPKKIKPQKPKSVFNSC